MKSLNSMIAVSMCIMTALLPRNINAQEDCPASLIHYWNLESNDNGFEDIINGLNAQVETGPTPVVGIVNSGQYFNSLSELNIPDDPTFDWKIDESFTIEFWINKISNCPDLLNSYNNVVIGRDDPGSKLHWWVGVSCRNPGRIIFSLYANDGSGISIEGKQNIIDGRWHHIAVVRDGNNNTTALFIDAVKDTMVTYSYSDGFSSQVPVNIGWLNLGEKYHLDATIDELAVYNNDISESTIIDHYNNRNGMDYCTGLVTSAKEIAIEKDVDLEVFPTIVTSQFQVSFKLNHTQIVHLSIYDGTGRKISELINEELSMGQHDMVFNILPSYRNSILIVNLQLVDKVITRKVVIR
ncbi:LamG domain-containing protein [bacterium]|nr:MAG: LamG domain-containing protein [bacterium]